MCRRCGEPDRRGRARDRRNRRIWLLSAASGFGGDGEKVPCASCAVMLDNLTMEVDRITPGWQCVTCEASVERHGLKRHPFNGGSYRRDNIRPVCKSCNLRRNLGNPWAKHAEEARCLTN